MIPVSPLGSMPPGQGSAPGENADQTTYPSAAAYMGVFIGMW